VYRVAGPSTWPMWTALAIGVMTLFLVFSQYLLAAFSFIVSLLTLAGWHMDTGDYSNPEEERAFEAEYGIRLNPHGSRAVARWGILLTIATLATALLTILFSYLYLRLTPPQWPPDGIPMAEPVIPAIGLLLLLLSLIPMRLAARAIQRNSAAGVGVNLAAVILLGLLYLGLNFYSYTQLGFDHTTQAFGSIFALLAAFQMISAIVGLAMIAITAFWFMRRSDRPARHQSIGDMAIYWYYTGFAGFITYLFLYLVPYVI
jgi:cytochrome c oxidase subunit I+III